jgi:3-phenylpropionate/cinnamic acid dioxygenase small subunit
LNPPEIDERDRSAEARERLRTIVSQSGRFLDACCFKEYVDLFEKGGTYILEAHSAEIGRNMVWLSLDQSGLTSLFEEWPSHVHDGSSRKHLIAVDEINFERSSATVHSTFVVFCTDQTGRTELYCIGTYEDQFSRAETGWKLAARRVKLETRVLSTPTPIPI